MSHETTRRKYAPEFKIEAVRLSRQPTLPPENGRLSLSHPSATSQSVSQDSRHWV